MRKTILSVSIVFLTVFIILANLPNVTAFTPTTGLDPTEGSLSDSSWQFNYGSSTNYGAYVRDVNWNSPLYGWNLYAGMINVPWIKITDTLTGTSTTYDIPGGSTGGGAMTLTAKSCTKIGTHDYYVLLAYTFTDATNPAITYWLEISFEFQDCPLVGGGGGGNGSGGTSPTRSGNTINIVEAYLSYNTPLSLVVTVPVRYDFDIINAASDSQYHWISSGWVKDTTETSYTGGLYKQDNSQVNNAFACLQTGSHPPNLYVVYLLRYSSTEYKGDPSTYANGQSLNGQDDLFWSYGWGNSGGSTSFWHSSVSFLY